jgi:DNA repair exonuclease SbcCD ATPase subunit
MRLKILRIRFKNLLSFGNAWTEMEFKDGQISLIIGKNGDGKSAFYEALYFGLYGKPFRKINKDGLINTTNGKNTVVEVELLADGKPVKIVRGIRPNTFEIYLNGVLKNQDASVWDYQGWLESTVLRMDERTFRQLVILGSTSFVPFMSLKTWERRSVIEDILSLGVYSQMLNVVKKKTGEANQTREDTSRAIENKRVQLTSLKRSLKDLDSVITTSASGYQEKIDHNNQLKTEAEAERQGVFEDLQEDGAAKTAAEIEKFNNLLSRTDKILTTLEATVTKADRDFAFFHDNDTCPTCSQDIH